MFHIILYFHKVVDNEFLKTDQGKIPDFPLISFLTTLYQSECLEVQFFLNLRIERQAYCGLKLILEYLYQVNIEMVFKPKSYYADQQQSLKTMMKSHDKERRY